MVLQDRGERIRVRPNDKIKMGDDGEWEDVGQVGQFQDGMWRVDVRDIWTATQQDRPVGRDSKREEATPRESSPQGPGSVIEEMYKKMK